MAEASSKLVEKAAAAIPAAPPKVVPTKPALVQVHVLSKGGALCDEFSKIRTYPYRDGHIYTGFENLVTGYTMPAGHEFCKECKDRFEQYNKK